jgi:hypothetical protein
VGVAAPHEFPTGHPTAGSLHLFVVLKEKHFLGTVMVFATLQRVRKAYGLQPHCAGSPSIGVSV